MTTAALPSWRDLAAQRVPPVDGEDLAWKRRWLGHPAYWRWQAGGWCFLWLSQASMTLVLPRGEDAHTGLLMMGAMCASGVLWTHVLRGVILGLRGGQPTWAGLLLRLLPWMLLLAVVWGASLTGLGMLLAGEDFVLTGPRGAHQSLTPERALAVAIFSIANAAMLIQIIWIAGYFMHHLFSAYQHSQLERLRIEASSREAEVRNLRRQMDPHFLFNSLNTVRALIPRENAEARDAVTHLSDLLRGSLRQSDKNLIPLREELAAIDSHLAIEQLRFGSRLLFHRHVGRGLDHWLVPPFLIQTLVENAIKHGVAKSEQGGTIVLHLRACRGTLCCMVWNPGTLEERSEGGLGLKNIRTRLQLLYQGNASFRLQQRRPGRVRAAVCLPQAAVL
ncbi:sensor histidine kinase [Luteolibacter luteus]|uniref:Histidine kinase n=1 Tax=Luteolibacter luteus TaxID=2728835 RepID=A0A858RCJ1_9BACT|nr:histidine kinase [Luteolibacter luteus]QJE94442.1 histidine kinase [Luteolibacter luteus]